MATSFIVILTGITTLTMNDEVVQGCLGLLMEFLKDPRLPWSVKHIIVQIASGPRCVLCDERRGQLCRINDVDELRCLTCVKGMMDNEVPFPEPLVDGIIRAEWSFVPCPIGSSLRDLSSVSEYSVL